ncbi:hypothetical protein FNW25_04425 [Flavobacterium franklandianum]|jgi:hypothetical protein|uniref:hypothetical protein n=1 Tax=Flavobacterium franklandianum TaxID=2594430 RepID=UPI00117A0405|nr:hypothetical protein [Flavobacterium franklandianum]TRX28641.1 hypothetical protein FNW25_04425 [Flavobacterium franklandianum]
MKKILVILSVIIIVSCQKNVDEKTKLFLESVDKVKLYTYPSRTTWDEKDKNTISEIKFEKGKLIFDKTKVVDSLVLTNEQKDKIYTILLDTKWEENGMIATCYEPRHLFSFYKNEKVIGYYEVCLECGGHECSKELENLPMFCIEKGEEMQKIFKGFKLKNIVEER